MAITLTINNVNNPINVNNTGGTITLTIGTGGIALISQLNDVNLTNLTDNQILVYDAATEKWVNENNSGGGGGSGTVTSVAMTVPTGLTVTGSPITTTGTFALAYSAGYVGYTTTEQTKLSGIETNADVTDATNVAAAGAFMKSVDDTDDITVGVTNKFATQTEKDKLANITVTQAVNLDTIEADSHTHSNKSILDATTASFTTADETKLDGIEALADVTDSGNVGSVVAGVTEKTTPIDADTIPLTDSAAANVLKKLSWSNIKATLKTYFDTLYQAAGSYLTSANITQTITNGVTTNAPSEDAVFDALALKQDTLVSGTNIKTVNSTSLVGSGNVAVQETLVSGTNIKTINGTTLLGSGDITVSGGGLDLATVGDSFVYETDFYAQSIPDGLTTHTSGAGSGFSYSNTMVEGHPGFAYPSPGTSAGALSGRAHICPTVDVGPTSGWTVGAGELDFTFIVQTASLAQSGTEDYFDIFGLSNSFFNPNPDNSVAITRQQGVNSGNWIFRYRTSSNQVTINGSSGSATSTWFVLRFKVAATTHACEFWINGVSQGTGTPATKITATNHAALYLGVAKVASAGGEPRPRWDYFRVQQSINRN